MYLTPTITWTEIIDRAVGGVSAEFTIGSSIIKLECLNWRKHLYRVKIWRKVVRRNISITSNTGQCPQIVIQALCEDGSCRTQEKLRGEKKDVWEIWCVGLNVIHSSLLESCYKHEENRWVPGLCATGYEQLVSSDIALSSDHLWFNTAVARESSGPRSELTEEPLNGIGSWGLTSHGFVWWRLTWHQLLNDTVVATTLAGGVSVLVWGAIWTGSTNIRYWGYQQRLRSHKICAVREFKWAQTERQKHLFDSACSIFCIGQLFICHSVCLLNVFRESCVGTIPFGSCSGSLKLRFFCILTYISLKFNILQISIANHELLVWANDIYLLTVSKVWCWHNVLPRFCNFSSHLIRLNVQSSPTILVQGIHNVRANEVMGISTIVEHYLK